MADISSAQMQGAEINGTKIVCVSIVDIEHRSAYLKFLVRRLRRIFPGVSLLGAFWKHDAGNTRLADIAGLIPDRVKSLAEAVAYCVNLAMAEAARPHAELQAQAS